MVADRNQNSIGSATRRSPGQSSFRCRRNDPGFTGNIIIMSPPLVITESEIDSLTQALSVGFAGA
ncbi:MAG: hypothetical protein Ct9H300mP14_07040 [Gammaproteobacteria bacterium]|nr:MAG: hypothetical protein Ct9H300mP14_07040 [Gammaproteobacteria bacterium]